MADTEVKEESNGQSTEKMNGSGDHVSKKEEPVSSKALEAKIVRQVEHYFGDYNLPRDKFLKETIQSDDGWVPMETMMKFQRLATLSTDEKLVIAALKQGGSGLMEVDEDKQKIRRCPTVPLPEWNDARREELMNTTVYVKGFEKTQTTLDDLLAFFGKFSNVLNVTKRLYEDRKDPERKKHFKGSVFVVFKDRDSAQNFMDLKSLKSPDEKEELTRKWQKEYFEEQDVEFNTLRKQRVDEKQSQKKAREFSKIDDKDSKVNLKKEIADLPLGALMKLDGFAENGDTSREDIKDKLVEDYGMAEDSLAFSYYSKGQTSSILRFHNENDAIKLAETMSIKTSNQAIYMKCKQKINYRTFRCLVEGKESKLDENEKVNGKINKEAQETYETEGIKQFDIKNEEKADIKNEKGDGVKDAEKSYLNKVGEHEKSGEDTKENAEEVVNVKNENVTSFKKEEVHFSANGDVAGLPKGVIIEIRLDGFAGTADTDVELIKKELMEVLELEEKYVASVQYNKGETSAGVCLIPVTTVKSLVEMLHQKLSNRSIAIECNQKISFKVLEGEEETHYLEECKNAIYEKKQQMRSNHKRRGGWSQGRGAKRNRKN